MGQICDGPMSKNLPDGMFYLCAKFHALIIKPTIRSKYFTYLLHSSSLHIRHSRSFATDIEEMECSSDAPSAELIDALGNVRSVSRSRLPLSISQAIISITWPVHGTLSLLGDPHEVSGGFRLSLMRVPRSSDCELRVL